MTEKEICELAAKLGDMTVDNKRRIDYCFDDYGILAFANAIAQRTREEVAQKLLQLGALEDGDYIEAIRSMTK